LAGDTRGHGFVIGSVGGFLAKFAESFLRLDPRAAVIGFERFVMPL